MNIEKCDSANFAELMDFLVDCFRVATPSHLRFEQMFPDLYSPDSEFLSSIIILREGGRIASSAGIFPISLQAGNKSLVIPGVGGVATHIDFRGKSLMTQAMDNIFATIISQNTPFAWLAGNRFRYGRWGWEKAGCCMNLKLWSRNSSQVQSSGFKVRQIGLEEIDYSELLNLRKAVLFRGNALAEELKYKYQRPGLKVYVAENSNKEKSYTVFHENLELVEYAGSPKGVSDTILSVLKETERISLSIPMINDSYYKVFMSFAEGWDIASCGSFAVVNLRQCLELIEENPYVHDIDPKENYGVNLVLRGSGIQEQKVFLGIENGKVIIEAHIAGAPDVVINPMMASSLIFGPQKPSLILEKPELNWLDSLLPLVLHIPKHYWV